MISSEPAALTLPGVRMIAMRSLRSMILPQMLYTRHGGKYLTTDKYNSMTRHFDAAVATLHVPEVLKQA